MRFLPWYWDRQHWIEASAVILTSVALYLLFFALIKRQARHKEYFLPTVLQHYLYSPGLMLILAGSATAVFPLFKHDMSRGVYTNIHHTLKILTIAAIGFLVIRILSVAREIAYKHYSRKSKGELKLRQVQTQFHLLQSIINSMIIFATLAAILVTFPNVRNLGTTLLASAGLIGIVLGFAAQKSLGTFVGGLQIAIAQPIRLGDVVVVEGTFGRIGEINLTYVVVHAWDGRRLVVPVSYFLEKPFENWTRMSPEVVGKVTLRVDYTVPVKKVRAEFHRILEASPLWDKRVSGMLVTSVDHRSIELRATMSAQNSGDAWDLECYIREELLEYIRDNFPGSFPQVRISGE